MLKVQGVNQFYGGSHILRDVSLTATQGQVTVVLGRNGVGKTTLLKSLMGLVAIKSGNIEFDGVQIQSHTPYMAVISLAANSSNSPSPVRWRRNRS